VETVSSEGLASDGVRYVVWKPTAGSIRVYDARRSSSILVSSACIPVGGRVGHFLLVCGQGQSFAILDARRGTAAPIPGAIDSDGFNAIGRYWTRGVEAGPPWNVLYVNWRTGQRVVVDPATDAKTPRDLDAPGLEPVTGLPFDGVAFYGRANGYSLVSPLHAARQATLYLVGHHRRIRLDRGCNPGCRAGDTSVAPYVGPSATWVRREGGPTSRWLIGTYLVGPRRTLRWRARFVPASYNPMVGVVAATAAGKLFMQVVTNDRWDTDVGGAVPARLRIYMARL
jgi:hypothetical protein